MKKQDLYRRALSTVRSRRQAAELALADRQRGIYEKEPQMLELDRALAAAGGRAAMLAAQGHAQLAEEEKANMAHLAGQKVQLLKQLGYAPDALAPQYSCALCGDTGMVDGAVCICVQEEMKRLRRSEINENGPLTLCRFESFRLEKYPEKMEQDGRPVRPRSHMQAVLEDCKAWADEFGPRSQSLYLFGDAGLGKTHLALSMASEVLDKGYDVIYVSAQRAFATIAQGEDEEGLFSSMLQADLLVLDDLGTELLTARVRSYIYDLVNTRMGRRPTIYTTNICSQELLERRYDEKVSSRLLGDCHLMRFWGEDIRLNKHRA